MTFDHSCLLNFSDQSKQFALPVYTPPHCTLPPSVHYPVHSHTSPSLQCILPLSKCSASQDFNLLQLHFEAAALSTCHSITCRISAIIAIYSYMNGYQKIASKGKMPSMVKQPLPYSFLLLLHLSFFHSSFILY